MFWPVVAIGLVGFVAGIRFRVPALILIAGVVAVGFIINGVISGVAWQSVTISTLAAIFSVNLGYILGVVLRLASASRKNREGPAARSRAVNG